MDKKEDLYVRGTIHFTNGDTERIESLFFDCTEDTINEAVIETYGLDHNEIEVITIDSVE